MDLLSVASLLLGAGIVGFGGLWLLDLFIRRSDVAITIFFVTYLSVIVLDRAVEVVVAGLTVTVADLMNALFLFAAIARLLREPGTNFGQRVGVLVGILLLTSQALTRGALAYGIEQSVNEARQWFDFLCPMLYMITVRNFEDIEEQVTRCLIWAGLILTGVVMLRWANAAAGIPIGPFELGARAASKAYGEEGIRVIHATDTLLLLDVALLLITRWQLADSRRHLQLGGLMLGVVAVLGHRTIWIAGLFALGVLYLRSREVANRLVAIGSVVAVLVVGVLVIQAGPDALSDAETARVQSVEQEEGLLADNTFLWRYRGWEYLLRQVEWTDAVEPYAGAPFGLGWTRRVNGQITEVSPHSGYVIAFLRMGFAGLGLLVYLFASTMAQLSRRKLTRRWLDDDLLLAFVVAHTAYFFAYNPDSAQGLLVGVAMISLASAASGIDRDTHQRALPVPSLPRR